MPQNYEYRFELKPNKFVYVPNKFTEVRGPRIAEQILKKWTPAEYLYHLTKKGGHVAAMRPHVGSKYKASIDLTAYFMNVTRSKVDRSLKKIGFSSKKAFNIAEDSCVEANGKKFLPYGFPQSMILATLAMEFSALGREISECRKNGLRITVYVDDILLSADRKTELLRCFKGICKAASKSNFQVSEKKSVPPTTSIEAFNCIVENEIKIKDERIEKFVDQIAAGSEQCRAAILKYVGAINTFQQSDLDLRTRP